MTSYELLLVAVAVFSLMSIGLALTAIEFKKHDKDKQ